MKATDLVDRLAEHKTLGAETREELAWLASHGSLRQLDAGDVLTAKGARVVWSGNIPGCYATVPLDEPGTSVTADASADVTMLPSLNRARVSP